MRVREATADDVPALVLMGQTFLRTSPYAGRIRDNPEALAGLMHRLIASDDGVVLVLDHKGKTQGMLGMIAYAHPLSADPIAGELFWWCEGGHGLALLRAAERWADEMGVVAVQMVSPDARAATIYEKRGYVMLETTYQRELH